MSWEMFVGPLEVSHAAYVLVFTLLVIAPVLWLSIAGPVPERARPFLFILAVLLGLAAALAPGAYEAAHQGPADNPGWAGIPIALIWFGLPLAVLATGIGFAARFITIAVLRRTRSLTQATATARTVGVMTGALLFVPLLSAAVWLGVGLIETG